MAKIMFGGGVSNASGKIGGTVYSRNKGGSYFRNWVYPNNPQTSKQQTQRNLLAAKSAAWRLLTTGERDAWDTWADENPILDRLGNSIKLSGAQAYNKINMNRTNAGDGATQADTPAAATFELDVIDTAGSLSIGITATEFQIPLSTGAAADQILFTHASLPVSAGVTNTNSNMRLIEVVTLDEDNILDGYYDIYTEYVAYIGSIATKAGFRINVSVQQYDEGQFSVPAKVTGTISA